MKILILSDGKKGHENQAIAYAKLLGSEYSIVHIAYKNRLFKALSYLFDWIGIYTKGLFQPFSYACNYDMVVGAGSSTYYALKLIAKKCSIPSVALMQPKGYRKSFERVYAQKHDGGELLVNFSYSEARNLYTPSKKCVALIVGGSNKIFTMKKEDIANIVNFIMKNFKEHEKALTTSPRTPKEVEDFLKQQPFDYKVLYSKNPINPIGDFLQKCAYVFITIDSTSMISEAVSSGKANIIVVPLEAKKKNKYEKMVQNLQKEGYVHIFDGNVQKANKKIDLRKFI